jgi:hypothetical protein
MLERLIFDVISAGVAEYVRDRRKIERLMLRRGIAEAEAVAIRDVFQRFAPSVIHQYPRETTKFPCYAIILGEEHEATQFLDDGGATIGPDMVEDLIAQGYEGALQRTSVWETHFHLLVASDESGGPDQTIVNYHVLRDILNWSRTHLKEHGVLVTRMSGSDLAPDPKYAPAYLFMRRLTLTVQAEAQTIEERDEIVRGVAGMHTNDGVITSVNTLVTPYTEE